MIMMKRGTMKGSSLRNKIGFFHTLLIFLSIEDINGSLFFHEHSYVELHTPDPNVDFGFSIAYQANLSSLVIGAPHSGLDGKVYTCPLDEAVKRKNFSCNSINIDIDELAGNYSRHDSVDQEFCLGASISATPEYIFTCAPLWTSDFVDGDKTKFGALGTCFITNGTYASRYNGLFEQYVQNPLKEKPKIDNIYGGIGWNTLYDPVNKLILIAKPSLTSSISVMNTSDPLKPTKAVFLGENFITYFLLGSFAAGVFFNNYNILYAFGMTSQSIHSGAIGFLHYDTSENVVKILKGTFKPIQIEDDSMNTMYGASLHSVDVNGDGYSELLVGAPAQTNDVVMYEHGAVHFYLGGGKSASKSNNDLCVYGVENGSRFGTAIGSTDIDGDGLPEIFISAPYEKSGKGAVYVLSGHIITKMLKNSAITLIKVTELTDMQRISNVPYKSFGFSILPVTDFYENDGKLLAVGSPNDGKVALFRSIPFINVTVTALLIGKERVKEDDMNFTVTVSVNVTFPPKANEISGRLTVTTDIIGDPAQIVNRTHTIDITTKEKLYTNDILVLLNGTDPGDYKFKVNVDSDIRRFDKPEYDNSFFMISNFSKSETVLDVVRRCKGNDCVPRLSMIFGAPDVYMLGSTEYENISVVVRNSGNVTYESCARIRVTGVKVTVVGCIQTKDDWYKCDLINIERNQERSIYIRLDMSKATNRDGNVTIEVLLYNTCAASGVKEAANQTKIIPFVLNTTEISIDYVSYDRNVTLTEIQDTETSPTVDVREFFMITNNGSVTWTSLPALIILDGCLGNNTVITPKGGECFEVSSKYQTIFHCTINLEPKSTFKITIIRSLFKENNVWENLSLGIFDNDKITINSMYNLRLEPTSIILNKTFTTTLYFQVDTSFGSNKYNIIVSAVIVALFVLVVIILILYKVGFFERKEKTKLDALKQEIKQKSIRRLNRDDAAATLQENNQGNIEVVDDYIPLQLMDLQDTRDSTSLIKNQEIKKG